MLRAGVKLRVTLPRHSGWVLVPVLNRRQRVCTRQRVCFCASLSEEGQESHLFLIPQKALLSGPGGAGVPVEDCEGEGGEGGEGGRRGRVYGHTHTVRVGGRCGAMWPCCFYSHLLLHFLPLLPL